MSRRPAPRRRGRWARRAKIAAGVAGGYLLFVLPSVVWADDSGPTTPDALGSLINPPASMIPAEGQTLFEAVPLSRYVLSTDLGIGDVTDGAATVIYQPLQLLAMLLMRLGIAVTWWLDRLTAANGLGDTIGQMVQTSAGALNAWLLPSALALGAGIAYAQARRGDSGLSQLLNVLVIGVLAVGLSASGAQVVKGLDSGRGLLADTIGNATGGAVATTDAPLAWPANFAGQDPQTQLARKSGDTIWRTFAVTPWCEAQFGSLAACQRYGPKWLTLDGQDAKKRYTDTEIVQAEGGSATSETVRYIEGHSPALRITVSIFAVVVAGAATLAIGGVAIAALMSWIIALLLLALAAVFLCLMVIPGRPRQIGFDYIQTVIGGTIFSAIAGGLLWSMLAASTAAAAAATPLGYLPMILLAIAVLSAGWKAKGILEGILYGGTSMRGGHGDRAVGLAGFLALRAATGAPRRLSRAGRLGRGAGRGDDPADTARGDSSSGTSSGRTGRGRPFGRTNRFVSLRPQGRRDAGAPRDQRPEPGHPGAEVTATGADSPPRRSTGTWVGPRARGALAGPRYNIQRRPTAAERHTRRTTAGERGRQRTDAPAATARPSKQSDGSRPAFVQRRFVELKPQPNRPGRPAGRFSDGSRRTP